MVIFLLNVKFSQQIHELYGTVHRYIIIYIVYLVHLIFFNRNKIAHHFNELQLIAK